MDNTQNNPEIVSRTASSFLLVIFLSFALFFSLKKIDTYLKNQAIYQCALISRYEQTDQKTGTKVSYPVADVYKQCLKDKGILR
ncbi:MAG: hypothetical protein WAT72_00010 [Microgenomates group bacterium]|jgi:hypothetical protein|nr:hypothetical protein [Candidatus Woesebacteria bacterium]MBP6883317.1 hypothetical protein [Candidatus Woesebacteria bacterium]